MNLFQAVFENEKQVWSNIYLSTVEELKILLPGEGEH